MIICGNHTPSAKKILLALNVGTSGPIPNSIVLDVKHFHGNANLCCALNSMQEMRTSSKY